MNNTIDNNTLLKQVIGMYSELEALYCAMDMTPFTAHSCDIDKINKQLSNVFQQITCVESSLAKQMDNKNILSETTRSLLNEREYILNRVCKQNKSLHCKISDIKALVQHDLGTVGAGRNAIKGYKPAISETKGLISNSW